MTGQMIEFEANGGATPGYLAVPANAAGAPGVVVLHAWWGLTEPFRQACDRLAEAGYIALAPDLYRGKTATTAEQADALGSALDEQVDHWRGDIAGALRYLRERSGKDTVDAPGKCALLGFSLGGAYAFDMSVTLADEVAAVVVFYDAYTGLDYGRATAAYLCHYAEDDTFVPAEKVATLKHDLEAGGKEAAIYVYPGTKHWFMEANQPTAYNAEAAALAWDRTLTFLSHVNPG